MTKPIFIHFDRCDPAGILFYGNYAALAHQTIEALLPALNIPWTEWFENSEFGVPIRHLQIEYLRPLFAGQTYQAKAYVGKMGTSSVEFCVEFATDQGTICTQVRSVHVFIDKKTFKAISIPQLLRQRLQNPKAATIHDT